MNQLANKVNGVNAMYGATAEEIKREYAGGRALKKQLLDSEVQKKHDECSRS